MITLSDLQTALLDLLYELQDTDIQLIIGGGYGIYLKADYVRQRGVRTLLQEWPEPRSTNDLDLFLRPELLTDSSKLIPFGEAISRLGYHVVTGAEKYQFIKPGPDGTDAGSIKIDILTGPQSRFIGTHVKTDDHRVRPRPSVGIHAHPVDEALTLEEGLISSMLAGKISSGDHYQEEWGYALKLRDQYRGDPYVIKAGHVVLELFSTSSTLGMIRLRESPYYRSELQLEEFISVLQELFPANS